MSFGFRRSYNKSKGRLMGSLLGAGGGLAGTLTGGLFGRSGNSGPGPDYGFTDPNAIKNPTLENLGFKPSAGSIDDLTHDIQNVGIGPEFQGLGLENDQGAYNEALDSGEAARRREEEQATNQVMAGLQGRGLLRSGITLNDIVSKVIGPSSERARQLAAQFGLEQAKRRSDLLEAERGRRASANQLLSQGRINALLNNANYQDSLDKQILEGLQQSNLEKLRGAYGERQLNLENQINKRNAFEERRRQRRSGLSKLLLGAGGDYLGKMTGQENLGNRLSDYGGSL